MATIMSLIVYDEDAAEGQGEVVALHMRPGLPTAATMALALQLAQMGQQMASTPPPPLPTYLDGPPPPGNGVGALGPADLLPTPGRGRGRGKA